MDINKYQIIAEMIFEKVKHYDEGVNYLEFYGEEYAWRNIRISSEILNEFGDRERQIINLLIEQGSISTSKCAKHLGVDPTTVRRHIRRLINKYDIIESVGEGSKRKYILKK